MLHAYCVRRVQEPSPAPGLRGVSGAPVRLLEHGRLGLWFSEAEPHPTVEALRQHETVVRSAMRSSTPLPFRFGTRLEDEAAIAILLETREAEFLAAFERIDQKVEMGVQVAWSGAHPESPRSRPLVPMRDGVVDEPPPTVPAAAEESVSSAAEESVLAAAQESVLAAAEEMTPGRAYLETVRRSLEGSAAARATAESVMDDVERAFAELGGEAVRMVIMRDGIIGSLAHLLGRDRIAAYREHAGKVQRERPDLRLTATGPWAPYSFV